MLLEGPTRGCEEDAGAVDGREGSGKGGRGGAEEQPQRRSRASSL